MQVLALQRIYFDAAVVFFKKTSLLFRFALAKWYVETLGDFV
jgi:hypothetical protein